MMISGERAERAYRRLERQRAIGPHDDARHPHLAELHNPWADAPVGGGPFTPLTPGGLMLWLDGSLGVTVVTGVSAWLDQSGNVNASATQLTPASQPTYTASDASYNNKGTLSFNGTTQFMTCAGALGVSQPNTWFVVGQSTMTAAFQTFVDSTSPRQFVDTVSTGPAVQVFAGVQLTSNNTTLPESTSLIWSIMNGASSTIGVNSSSPLIGMANAGTNAVGTVSIGATATPANFLNGKIAALLCYNGSLSLATRMQVVSYLASRFGQSWT